MTQDHSEVTSLADRFFDSHLEMIHRRTDRLFGTLMLTQWLCCLLLAIFVSPWSWRGSQFGVHIHAYSALLLGGCIALYPAYLSFAMPGKVLTRHSLAIAQGLMSALLIHLSGGRIETHFHVFGSLALLAFYRDWKVLVSASAVIAMDHFVRGVFWPRSVFGIESVDNWRWIEHTMWVLFEDIFLIQASLQGVAEIKHIARNRAELETTNARIENQIVDRTRKLAQREGELQAMLQASADAIMSVDTNGRVWSFNEAAADLFGDGVHAQPCFLKSLLVDRDGNDGSHLIDKAHRQVLAGTRSSCVPLAHYQSQRLIEATITAIASPGQRNMFMWVMRDVSERVVAESTQKELHRQQVEIARVAGKSEIATGVLHNVGNALNSVNVSANLIQNSMSDSKVGRVADIARILNEQEDLARFLTTDQRGKRIPEYLNFLANELACESESNRTEIRQLLAHIQHIKAVVATQQSIAKPIGLIEEVQLADLLDESINAQIGLYGQSTDVVKDYEPLPSVRIDRARVMQILFNLIKNAKESARDSGVASPRIHVSLKSQADSICIAVTDNGIGIAPEQLDRIFSHGFTTKDYGHGFGLHTSANAATEMGGNMSVTSKGLGEGATFKLVVPKEPAASQSEQAKFSPTPI